MPRRPFHEDHLGACVERRSELGRVVDRIGFDPDYLSARAIVIRPSADERGANMQWLNSHVWATQRTVDYRWSVIRALGRSAARTSAVRESDRAAEARQDTLIDLVHNRDSTRLASVEAVLG